MQELSDYSPVNLSETDKQHFEAMMAKAFEVFQRAALERYNFANVKKLRDEYKSQSSSNRNMLWADPQARKMMQWMIAHEQQIIAAYIRISNDLCSAFALAHDAGPSYADYLQEAAVAIYDAMYQYNGSTKFSTYVHWVIKNRLITFRRSEMSSKGFTRSLLKIKASVKDLMTQGLTADRAIAQLRDDGVEIDPRSLERLRTSLGLVGDEPKLEAAAPAIDHDSKTEFDAMKSAIAKTDLTEMEKNLIEAHLRGDESYRRIVSETVINPTTGKLWTKQRLSQIFLSACDKIRATYENCKEAA